MYGILIRYLLQGGDKNELEQALKETQEEVQDAKEELEDVNAELQDLKAELEKMQKYCLEGATGIP